MTIELVGIRKSYKHKKVLEDVSLKVREGSCVCILGVNGCGKSTLFSILAGVQQADDGAFLYQDKDLLKDSTWQKNVLGYVPQGNPLIEELNAWDNLRMWYDKNTIRNELSDGVLSMLGIDSFLKIPVCKMSGGMKKRLSIGCTVAAHPKILLLDEPLTALDIICKEHIYQYIKQYKREGGTVLLTTHDAQDLELCDEYYILKQGALFHYQYDGNIHRLAGNL